jgi:hypothetical protein
MSLYKFIESYIEENPDLTKINLHSDIGYTEIYKFYETQVKA